MVLLLHSLINLSLNTIIMKRLFYFTFLLVFLNIKCFAQNVEWAFGFVGNGNEEGHAIALDDAGNTYLTGRFQGTVDFDPSPGGTFNLTSQGSTDIFIQKLDSQGNFVWAKSFGGSLIDEGLDIVVTSSNEIVIAGTFTLTVDFDPGPGTFNLNAPSDGRIFLLKLDSSGNFVWAKAIGGSSYYDGNVNIERHSLDIDDNDNLFLIGDFDDSPDFDPSASTLNLTSNGSKDVFIISLDNSGNLIWVKSFGGTDRDLPIGISIDGSGNIITAGEFESTTIDLDPGSGTFNISATENVNSFVQKLDANGNFLWALSYGDGDQSERVKIMTTDSSNSIYLVGNVLFTTDFDPGPSVFNLNSSSGSTETYVMKLDASGMFEWAGVYSAYDDLGALSTDNQNNLYISGNFSGFVSFDIASAGNSLNSIGSIDGYISKFDENGVHQWVAQLSSDTSLTTFDVLADNSGFIYCTGYFFADNAISDENGGWLINGTKLGSDIFMVKLDQPTMSTHQDNIENLVQYPNPTFGRVYFNGLDVVNTFQICIINSNGKIIREDTGTLENGLELPEEPGLYFIQLTNINKLTKTFKVLKR